MSELTKAITKYVRVEAGGKDMSVKINKAKARIILMKRGFEIEKR